jgi:hypothetical protein
MCVWTCKGLLFERISADADAAATEPAAMSAGLGCALAEPKCEPTTAVGAPTHGALSTNPLFPLSNARRAGSVGRVLYCWCPTLTTRRGGDGAGVASGAGASSSHTAPPPHTMTPMPPASVPASFDPIRHMLPVLAPPSPASLEAPPEGPSQHTSLPFRNKSQNLDEISTMEKTKICALLRTTQIFD